MAYMDRDVQKRLLNLITYSQFGLWPSLSPCINILIVLFTFYATNIALVTYAAYLQCNHGMINFLSDIHT